MSIYAQVGTNGRAHGEGLWLLGLWAVGIEGRQSGATLESVQRCTQSSAAERTLTGSIEGGGSRPRALPIGSTKLGTTVSGP